MKHMGEFIKNYLERSGFALEEVRFKKRIFADCIAATTYSIASVVLIIIQKADLIVLGLNILCLFRATINSTICASEVTNRIRGSDIESKCVINNHYRTRGIALAISLFYTFVLWATLCFSGRADQVYYENSIGNELVILIKFFASAAILLVLYNDIENNLVCAYNAKIKINPI